MSKVSLGSALTAPSFYDYIGDKEKAKKAEILVEEHLANHSSSDGDEYLFIEVSRADKALLEAYKKYNKQINKG
ncbi:hypothetical protein LY624_03645 [Pseudoalteromonas sp. N1230-9]|uniref:hypothetical protein n=1 Tax=unclassified Pseudoalteromonas TaxID=194690 RepID=UPI001023A200|nr:hypothetical protein EXT42_10355 [Pseudoalteromonas sp. CO302Y]RZG09194.1 hypothetical protein EXT40_10370 [Pseudoalteromonas sp. CO133X]WOC26997.1 hypothetical protein LY624_03645 [Pseudoalteromonas sp. N1230-9]